MVLLATLVLTFRLLVLTLVLRYVLLPGPSKRLKWRIGGCMTASFLVEGWLRDGQPGAWVVQLALVLFVVTSSKR